MKKKLKTRIYFDFDGTVVDLYGMSDWKEKLENEERGLFISCQPLVDMDLLNALCNALKIYHYEFIGITWLPKNASRKYEIDCEEEKKAWAEQHFTALDKVKCLSYGVAKRHGAKKGKSYLIDDNAEVLAQWETPIERTAIHADNMIEFLLELLLQEMKTAEVAI